MLFIVTGASSGIGFSVASALANRNQDVIAVARSTDRLESLKRIGGEYIQIISADLSTEQGLNSLLEKARSVGKIDGIVHAAGSLIAPTEYRDLKADRIIADLNIHLTVPITINNALNDELAGGRILYIDSYSASTLRIGWSGYSIVKAAAQMAARSAAAEITNAAVIRVFPGAVKTPLIDNILSSQRSSPTVELFKGLEASAEITEASKVGEFIADILVTATDEQLKEREIWDINNPDDRIF